MLNETLDPQATSLACGLSLALSAEQADSNYSMLTFFGDNKHLLCSQCVFPHLGTYICANKLENNHLLLIYVN